MQGTAKSIAETDNRLLSGAIINSSMNLDFFEHATALGPGIWLKVTWCLHCITCISEEKKGEKVPAFQILPRNNLHILITMLPKTCNECTCIMCKFHWFHHRGIARGGRPRGTRDPPWGWNIIIIKSDILWTPSHTFWTCKFKDSLPYKIVGFQIGTGYWHNCTYIACLLVILHTGPPSPPQWENLATPLHHMVIFGLSCDRIFFDLLNISFISLNKLIKELFDMEHSVLVIINNKWQSCCFKSTFSCHQYEMD